MTNIHTGANIRTMCEMTSSRQGGVASVALVDSRTFIGPSSRRSVVVRGPISALRNTNQRAFRSTGGISIENVPINHPLFVVGRSGDHVVVVTQLGHGVAKVVLDCQCQDSVYSVQPSQR